MPTVEHSTLTTGELHEPKGAAGAAAGSSYIADGAGSGNWYPLYHFGGHLSFDKTTPAYSHSVTTSDTVFNPTFTATHSSGFTSTSTPNARVTYTGTPDIHCLFNFSVSSQQASGSSKDIEYVFYKNGVAQEESRMIRSASTASWGSTSVVWDETISNGDYFEVFVKGSGACTLLVANAYLVIKGVHE